MRNCGEIPYKNKVCNLCDGAKGSICHSDMRERQWRVHYTRKHKHKIRRQSNTPFSLNLLHDRLFYFGNTLGLWIVAVWPSSPGPFSNFRRSSAVIFPVFQNPSAPSSERDEKTFSTTNVCIMREITGKQTTKTVHDRQINGNK